MTTAKSDTPLLSRRDRIADRVARCNVLLGVIGSTGRKFFRHGEVISHLERDSHGRIYFVDSYNKQRIYVSCPNGEWPGFHNGGTLRALVSSMVEFIKTGESPNWGLSFGRHWGYGDDMADVVLHAIELGFIREPDMAPQLGPRFREWLIKHWADQERDKKVMELTRIKFTGTDEAKESFLIALGWETAGGTWHQRKENARFHVEWRSMDEAFDHELRYLITGKV